MIPPLIKLNSISKYFNGNKVLSSVDLTINQGQIITLIGPNGAGKTTLVKIVLGLIHADEGVISRSPDLRIGYMPQKLHIDPTMPITLERFLNLTEKNKKLCADVLDEVGVIQLLSCPLSSLSGGEMQRALLARAILHKPNFLVLDEPVQGVDVVGSSNVTSFTFGQMVSTNNSYSEIDNVGMKFYNGRPTIKSKVKLASEQVSGIMIWELGQDSFSDYSLLKTIHKEYNNLGFKTSGLCLD